jgi:hypothetical protein
MTVLDALIAALQRAADYNRNDQIAPRLPLLMYGTYAPAQRTGPTY